MSENKLITLVLAGFVVAFAAIGYLAYRHHQQVVAECEARGGEIERVNCHEVEVQDCMTTDYGNGMMITTCSPSTSTVCDHECVVPGAR